MIERNDGNVRLEFANGYAIEIEFTSKNDRNPSVFRDRYVKIDTFTPSGSLKNSGYYSADDMSDLIARVSRENSL